MNNTPVHDHLPISEHTIHAIPTLTPPEAVMMIRSRAALIGQLTPVTPLIARASASISPELAGTGVWSTWRDGAVGCGEGADGKMMALECLSERQQGTIHVPIDRRVHSGGEGWGRGLDTHQQHQGRFPPTKQQTLFNTAIRAGGRGWGRGKDWTYDMRRRVEDGSVVQLGVLHPDSAVRDYERQQ